jgi:hypothetical protein
VIDLPPDGLAPMPPISTTCVVLANNATALPSLKVGLTTVRSNRCPVPFHGSLVISTSPVLERLDRNASRKWRTARAMVLTCPGVPVTACATMRPWRSKTPAEMSPASRAAVLKAVRTSVSACSLDDGDQRFPQHLAFDLAQTVLLMGRSFR